MVEGKILQGSPKCANMNCQKQSARNEHGSCYYCPSGAGAYNQHPQGFFYCHQCHSFIAQTAATVIQQPMFITMKNKSQIVASQQNDYNNSKRRTKNQTALTSKAPVKAQNVSSQNNDQVKRVISGINFKGNYICVSTNVPSN